MKKAKEKGIHTYLATNPVFPRIATMNRTRWAGLDAADFELITTYEDNCYCKPNIDNYRTILEKFVLTPETCLMVGNDVEEDLAIRELGVKTFLLTDTMENKKDLPIESDYQGTMEELLSFIERLENAFSTLAHTSRLQIGYKLFHHFFSNEFRFDTKLIHWVLLF